MNPRNTTITAEIISIGDEMTSGKRLDTNSQWLSQQLNDIGISVTLHSTVADDIAAMTSLFQNASRRSNIVLISGGLGPTADDLTRQVLATTAGVKLLQDAAILDSIRQRFESYGRKMPPNNIAQAMFPKGSTVVPNPMGTAPGVDLQIERTQHRCRMIAFPGVPAELKKMWRETICPQLQKENPGVGFIKHHSVHTFGLSESNLETRLPKLIERGRIPVVGITASKATITLRITAKAETEPDCDQQIAETVQQIKEELGDLVFAENELTLQQVVIEELRSARMTLAVVDAGNCSLIADWLHEADPDGEFYKGTISVAASADKASQQRFCELARQEFRSDLVLLIGPVFKEAKIQERDVTILDGDNRNQSRFNVLTNSPITITRAINQALNFLRLTLQRSE